VPTTSPQRPMKFPFYTGLSRFISLVKDGLNNSITGRCLGRLPRRSIILWLASAKSYFIGWTGEHKLVILRFPVEFESKLQPRY